MKTIILKYVVPILVVIGIVVTISILSHRCSVLKDTVERWEHNYDILSDTLSNVRDKNGALVSRVGGLEMSYQEVSDRADRYMKLANDLGLQLRRVRQSSETGIQIRDSLILQLRDSLYRIGDLDTVVSAKAFDHADGYLSLSGTVLSDSIKLQYTYRDTIEQVLYRIPKWEWWIFRCGTKGVEQYIRVRNPRGEVTYSRVLQIQDRKR